MAIGVQITFDVYACNVENLESEAIIKQLVGLISDKLNAIVVKIYLHHFSPIGISCIAQISASHIAIHTWPEERFAAIDIFSCNAVPENQDFHSLIISSLGAMEIKSERFIRGELLHSTDGKNGI